MDIPSLDQSSDLKIYFGIVVEDKEINSPIAKVWIPELLPLYDGGLKDSSTQEKAKVKDTTTGIVDELEVTTSNYIECTYFNAFTNRMYPPDIRKGETVWVIRHADTDIFKWYSTGDKDNHRGLERVRIIAVDDNRRNKELNDDNVYIAELSTRDGHILLQTAQSNGERHRYRFKIDTVASTAEMTDEMSNYTRIDSDKHQVIAQNVDGSKAEVIGKVANVVGVDIVNVDAGTTVNVRGGSTVNVEGGDSVNVKGGSSVNVQGGSNVNVEGGSSVAIKGGGSVTIDAGSSLSASAPSVDIKAAASVNIQASSATVMSPVIALNGAVMVGGPLTMAPPAGGGGGDCKGTMQGDMEIKGNLVLSGNVTIGGSLHASSITGGTIFAAVASDNMHTHPGL